jgi:hypothetical protein
MKRHRVGPESRDLFSLTISWNIQSPPAVNIHSGEKRMLLAEDQQRQITHEFLKEVARRIDANRKREAAAIRN